MSPSPRNLARFATRRPWTVVGIWIAILALGGFFAAQIGDSLSTDAEVYEKFEAARADDLIEERIPDPASEFVLVQSTDGATVDDPAFQTATEDLITNLRALEYEVAGVQSYYETGDETLVAADRGTLMVPVFYTANDDPDQLVEPIFDAVHELNDEPGFTVATGGVGSIDHTFFETSEKDLQAAEIFGIPAAMVVLVIVFGALVAAGMPLLVGVFGIVIALGIASVIGMQFELSFFVVNMVTMIGLATGIDYSLIVIQRFREERAHGATIDDAIVTTGSTASRAVLFSGLAVVVALCGMFIVPDSIFRSLAVGAIAVVIVAVSATLTLLPAVLRLLGDRVNKGRIPIVGGSGKIETGNGFWAKTTHTVMAHPIVSVVLSVGVLLAAASPLLGMELGMNGIGALPDDSDPKQAFTLLEEEFNGGLLSPVDIVVEASPDGDDMAAAIDSLQARLAEDPVFGQLTSRTNDARDILVLSTPINAEPESNVALDALDRLRDDYLPTAFASIDAEINVGGETAFSKDYSELIGRYTPIVFTFVLGLSFLILLVVFRSIVVPLKALVMNLLSVGAAYGLMVLVFQEGVLADTLGFNQTEKIETWVPLFLFTVLFGLSMDYHVFLLSRIRERFDQTGNNAESVAFGLQSTAGLITGAAAIMVVVFTGFALGSLAMFQQMGFGLAVAVFLDATIIRIVLVPASMELLGNANWYLPSWLQWLPNVDVEGAAAAEPQLELAAGQ